MLAPSLAVARDLDDQVRDELDDQGRNVEGDADADGVAHPEHALEQLPVHDEEGQAGEEDGEGDEEAEAEEDALG